MVHSFSSDICRGVCDHNDLIFHNILLDADALAAIRNQIKIELNFGFCDHRRGNKLSQNVNVQITHKKKKRYGYI